MPQQLITYRLEVEHLRPSSKGGEDNRENLWLSCHKCNKVRSNRVNLTDPLSGKEVAIFNPRSDNWHEHFAWETNGPRIIGLTVRGRATVDGLRLNDDYHLTARKAWMATGLYPR
jgi:hypothetical protein